mgnify:CR=1 FL=1
METKTDKARKLVASGQYKEALRMASQWRYMTREQKVAISRAYEMMVRPEFYTQLGFDKQATITRGVEALKAVLA